MNVVLVDRAVKMSGQNLSFLGWMDLSCMQLKTCVFRQCGNSWEKKTQEDFKGLCEFFLHDYCNDFFSWRKWQ